jgi:hypothetical protein
VKKPATAKAELVICRPFPIAAIKFCVSNRNFTSSTIALSDENFELFPFLNYFDHDQRYYNFEIQIYNSKIAAFEFGIDSL